MRNPIFIRHRINSTKELDLVQQAWGVEVDIRSRRGKLVLNHEPHANGDALEEFLAKLKRRRIRGPLIFEPARKEDGHERAILSLLKKMKVANFFFLDTAFPTLVRLAVKENISDLALRVSEYEPYEAALRLKGAVQWIWLDCFSGKPAPLSLVKKIKKDFKICLVSPELQGYPPERIALFRPLAPYVSAVCSKYSSLWQ